MPRYFDALNLRISASITFHFGLRWLKGRPGWAVLFGAIGGPLAFLAGRRLGVVTLHPDLWPSLLSLAASWSLAPAQWRTRHSKIAKVACRYSPR